MPDAALFFAAGFGTRMRPLTLDRPKPLIEVGGTALLDHALALGEAADLARMVVNTHYLGEMIAEHLQGRDITISAELETILDTGGGLRQALPLLGTGPVFTMNTDAVWAGPNPFTCLAEHWQPERMDALLLLVPPHAADGHAGSGDFDLLQDGQLRRGTERIYTGAQITRTERLHEFGDGAFSLNRLWDLQIAAGRAFGLDYTGLWCDVGRPETLPLAEEILAHSDV